MDVSNYFQHKSSKNTTLENYTYVLQQQITRQMTGCSQRRQTSSRCRHLANWTTHASSDSGPFAL